MVKFMQTTVICNLRQLEFGSLYVIVQLKIYHCDGAIYRGWAFCPKGWAFCPKGWPFCPFCVKFVKPFYFYDIVYIYDENICTSGIRCVFGHGSIPKSFIHWLLRSKPAFLGWVSCPMLLYLFQAHKFTYLITSLVWESSVQAGELGPVSI